MSNDSIQKTLIVTISLCIFCSILVSGSAVLLRDTQERNQALDKRKNILITAGLVEKTANAKVIEETFKNNIESALYDFENNTLSNEVPEGFDQRKADKDPKKSSRIENDFANIKTRSKKGLVYFVKKDNQIQQIILPVHGKGLWSTLYGFLSIDKDMNTIKGISFYEHKETPGLGGEVDNEKWKALWQGKLVYADNGDVKIQVIKGQVEPSTSDANYKVDGLSGATITSRGVSNMMKYWFGADAYGPLLKNLKLNQQNPSSVSSKPTQQGVTHVN